MHKETEEARAKISKPRQNSNMTHCGGLLVVGGAVVGRVAAAARWRDNAGLDHLGLGDVVLTTLKLVFLDGFVNRFQQLRVKVPAPIDTAQILNEI